MKLKKILSSVLSAMMVFSTTVVTFAEETTIDTTWYNDTDKTFTLSDKADLYGFAQLVNEGNNFSGKTITLENNIDLNNEKWTPIGANGKTFRGIFDGGNNTISNIYVNETYENVGFFGKTEDPALLQNFTLNNVEITGARKAVGAVVGNAYTGKGIKNVSVTGKIAISGGWYVGGINGGMSYVAYENCTVDGSNSENFDSYIKATIPGSYTNYVGGICGLAGEGGSGIDKCTVKNVKLIATEGVGVGGICGVMQYDYSITNCSVINVELIHENNTDGAEWTGTIAGKDFSKSQYGASLVINCETENVTGSAAGNELTEIFWLGNDYTGTYPPYDNYDPQAIIGIDVTYDDNGKINGGTIILVGNNDTVKTAAQNMLADGMSLGTVQVDGSYTVDVKKTGTITTGYVSTTDIWGELHTNATKSIEIEIYSGEEKLAKTTLNNIGGIIDGDIFVTWHNNLVGNFDEYWTTEWYGKNPVVNVVPDKVVLIADGQKVAENTVAMHGPDNLNPVVWAELAGINPDTPTVTTLKSLAEYLIDYMPIASYPGNTTLYRLGLYAAADSDAYAEYGFEVSVDGANPVKIVANKYSSAINVVVADETKEISASGLNYDGSNNTCVFGQIISFPAECNGANRITFRPYVVDNGEYKYGYNFTLPMLYTK